MKKKPPLKRIPSILGLFLLLISIFAGVFLSSKPLSFGSRADTPCQPVNLQVTNLTHQSFDISFTTGQSCSSTLLFDNQIYPNYYSNKSLVHYFHLPNLPSNSTHQFSLLIDNRTYESDQYRATTASQPSASIPESDLAWGKVFTSDSQPASGSLVFLNIPGASPLSALVTQNGNWNISLATSFNSLKTNWFTPPQDIEEEIIVISPDGQATQVAGNTSANNPVPDIILGQDSFSYSPQSRSSPPALATTSPSANFSSPLTIDNPGQDEAVNTPLPQFFGSAPAGQKIIITLNSPQTINGQTLSSATGSWAWSPPTGLTPGDHTVTVKTQDPDTGLWQTVTRQFTVFAADDGLAFSASPSATLITPTASIIFTPTLVPTLPAIATATAGLIPTIRTGKPSTQSGIPSPGYSLPTFAFLILAFSLLASGAYLLKSKN